MPTAEGYMPSTINMTTLRTNMIQYYVQAEGIPQFIVMMEDAQKKAKQAGMPIADVEIVMMASAAVLAAQHFPCKVTDWEGRLAINRTWRAWKVEFRQAHIKCQCQLQCKRLGAANHSVGLTPSSPPHSAPLTAWEQRLTTSPSW